MISSIPKQSCTFSTDVLIFRKIKVIQNVNEEVPQSLYKLYIKIAVEK